MIKSKSIYFFTHQGAFKNQVLPSLLIITVFSLLAYAPFIPFLGFYGDDFFFNYVAHFYKIQGLIQSLVIDRPFNGYGLIFFYFILGLKDNVLLWHIFAFLMRLTGGYILFFLLRKIWPNKLYAITSITLIFLIYPGFLQQFLPLGYSIWITNLTLWIISLLLTVYAVKSTNKLKLFFFTLMALILQLHSFLQAEFFIGMEVLRFLIITYILQSKISLKSIKKTIIYWLPYLTGLLAFVLWRILIFKSTREVTDINWVTQTYYSNPVWIAKIPLEIINSFIQTIAFAYFLPSIFNFIRLPLQFSFIAIFLGGASALLFQLYYKIVSTEKGNRKLGKDLLLIGAISILGSLIPIIISGRFVRMIKVFDRYTLTSTIGVGIIITGFLLFKIPNIWRRFFLTSLVFLSVTSHLMNGFYRVDYWNKQRDLWWQLYWRAPRIENNAMLILDFPPVTKDGLFKDIINKVQWYRFYWVDYQIWTAGNLFFNNNSNPQTHFTGDFLADKTTLDKIKNQTTESLTDRNITYTRYYKNTVIISTPSDTSCLWVLDKNQNVFPSHANKILKSSAIYSNTDKLVSTESAVIPPREIFGDEPPHNWCYYFQKASLARQLKKWDKLSQLKREVLQKNLKPKDPNEWLVFDTNIR